MAAKIALINPKSPTNVGGVLRAAGCYGASAIYFTGRRYAIAQQYNKAQRHQTDTQNIAESLTPKHVDAIDNIPTANTKLIVIELVEGATPLPDFTHPENALYVFGPEDGSVSQEVVNQADEVVYIPTTGCMNLAASVNVVLYDRLAKMQHYPKDNSLIVQSRDNNNRIKWQK